MPPFRPQSDLVNMPAMTDATSGPAERMLSAAPGPPFLIYDITTGQDRKLRTNRENRSENIEVDELHLHQRVLESPTLSVANDVKVSDGRTSAQVNSYRLSCIDENKFYAKQQPQTCLEWPALPFRPFTHLQQSLETT